MDYPTDKADAALLRGHIVNGYHAMAIDEHRCDFAPTLWTIRHPKDPKAIIAAHPGASALDVEEG